MSGFGFLLIPSAPQMILFGRQLQSAVARFGDHLVPKKHDRVRGRKVKYERHQLGIYQEDTEVLIIQITMDGQNFDLTDFNLRGQIREKPTAPLIYEKILVDGEDETDFTQGYLVFIIPGSITQDLPAKALMDIIATPKNGDPNAQSTIFSALLERMDDITR